MRGRLWRKKLEKSEDPEVQPTGMPKASDPGERPVSQIIHEHPGPTCNLGGPDHAGCGPVAVENDGAEIRLPEAEREHVTAEGLSCWCVPNIVHVSATPTPLSVPVDETIALESFRTWVTEHGGTVPEDVEVVAIAIERDVETDQQTGVRAVTSDGHKFIVYDDGRLEVTVGPAATLARIEEPDEDAPHGITSETFR